MNNILSKIELEMTREEVVDILGKPNMMGGASNKYKTPPIYKYGNIELWFEPWKNGKLYTIWDSKKHKIIKTI